MLAYTCSMSYYTIYVDDDYVQGKNANFVISLDKYKKNIQIVVMKSSCGLISYKRVSTDNAIHKSYVT